MGVYPYGELPEELSGFVYFQAARERHKPRRGERVAVLVVEGTASYVVAFLGSLRSIGELEARLREQDAEMTPVSKASLEKVMAEGGGQS